MGVAKAVAVRLGRLIALLFVVSFLTFGLVHMLPGDPVTQILGPAAASNEELHAAVEHKLGLDQPLFQQYKTYMSNVLHGDLGKSYDSNFETTTLLKTALPPTIELMILAQLLSLLISIPAAMYSAYKANTRADRAITTTSFGLISFPSYASAVLLVAVFALWLGWFPAVGYKSISEAGLIENLRYLALPLMVLVGGLTAVYTRLLRSDLIATLQEDFVLMARSKGLPTWHILLRHALRPSSFTLLTVFGINFGTLIGGSVIVEQFFAIPGVGSLAVVSFFKRDFLVVQGVVLVITATFIIVNFIVDALYSVLDPRVRRAGAA